MNDKIKGIHQKLVVSCQALPHEPLHSSFIMGRMALAAFQGGACGIRANTKEDIAVYITPTMKEIEELMEVKPAIILSRLHTLPSITIKEFAMIFGNVKDLDNYTYLDEKIQKCFQYAAEHDLLSYEKGRHDIDGDALFVNIVEYETTTPEERFWEAHKYYLDLHVMLRGPEQIDGNFIQNMEQKDFVEKDDFLPLEGEPNNHVVLEDGDFLLCYPADAHRTAVAVNGPAKIKKAIFKIKI